MQTKEHVNTSDHCATSMPALITIVYKLAYVTRLLQQGDAAKGPAVQDIMYLFTQKVTMHSWARLNYNDTFLCLEFSSVVSMV